jgi:hypothetical protein
MVGLQAVLGFFRIGTKPLERKEGGAALLQLPVGTVQARNFGTKHFRKFRFQHTVVVILVAAVGHTVLWWCLGALVNAKLGIKWSYFPRSIKD